MKALGVVALVLIFGFIGFIVYQSDSVDDIVEITGADVSRLQEVTRTINCYTETRDFTCGTVTFNYNNDAILEETEVIQVVETQTVTSENGTVTTHEVTKEVVVPKISEADIKFLDKQTGEFMVCHQGDQCLITAQVKLYRADESFVEPPYLYSLTISCEYREWCNKKSTVSTNAGQTTDGGGGILYTWTTDANDQLGGYEIILSIRSAVPDLNGNPINLVETIPLVLIS
ncbi:MAG: hypothetical protein OPY03_01795 [Nitrosopumilus sp.]|nr:hypothetical protein [Nitrosopumilus sp.]